MYRLGWFSTGRGQGSRGLLREMQDKIQSGGIEAEIEFVFCSRDPGGRPGGYRSGGCSFSLEVRLR